MSQQFVQGVHLRRTAENVDEIDALAELLGGRAGVGGVLDDPNRRGVSARVPGRATGPGFRWDLDDTASARWWPQGVTWSVDDTDGRQVLAASWYSRKLRDLAKGSRLSFVDLSTLAYRHVLLVQPVMVDGRIDIRPLNVHAGGIVWCGPYLHVAGTSKGLFTCRVSDILRVPGRLFDTDRDKIGRQPGGTLASYGYRYVLPVRFSYQAFSDEGLPRMRYSFLSLDRSQGDPYLVAGEYGRAEQTTRLVRYPLDPSTYHLVTGDDGFSRPLLLEDRGEKQMQGAALVGDTWHITSSRGATSLGSMYVGRPGAFREHKKALPMGCEDLAYWPSRDVFWSVSEWPGLRWVYSMERRQFG